jgi:hypothetical protein
MTGDLDPRARQLYEEGATILAARWDDSVAMCRDDDTSGLHSPRATLGYAAVLLREGGAANVERAARAIRAVLALQERREDDAHLGNFRWLLEEPVVRDLNGVEFMLDGLNAIIRMPGLPDDLAAEVRDAIALGLDEIDALDVHPSYTNIYLSDVCNSLLGGETLQAAAVETPAGAEGAYYVDRGDRRLDDWHAFTDASGAPHEYNSPTYLAVDIMRMAFLAEHTADPDIALKARMAEERLWLHVAAHYHPALAQLAGPHSRSYFDGWTGEGGYLKLILWRLLGDDTLRHPPIYAPRHREEGQTGVALETFHCPDYVQRWLREKRFPFAAHETADEPGGQDLATYMTPSYALGAASHSYRVGAPAEQWESPNGLLLQFRRPQPPGYGTLFTRYVIDGHGHGIGDSPREEDWPEGGTSVAAQHRNRAIIAYGLRPRLRPTGSYRLTVQVLGAAGAEVRVGGRAVSPSHDATIVAPGEAVCIGAGDPATGVFVALIPLDPSHMGAAVPIELRRDGEQLSLDVYNYRGHPKQFWEHRSQAGPFYQGNVRNAVIVEVAERIEFASLDAFADHVASAMVADSVGDDHVREIAYASEGGSIVLRYSLWDMSPAGRTFDGEPYSSAMARAGALDGGGPQLICSRDSLIQLGRAKLLAGMSAKTLLADDDARRYILLHCNDEDTPLWLETPDTVVECDDFAFGRIDLDDAAGTVAIEAAGSIGPIRIRGAGAIRMAVNGVDVSGSLIQIADSVREFQGL